MRRRPVFRHPTGGGPPSLFAQVLALAAGRPVFTADNYTVDGVTGEVANWIDHSDPTHLLEQSIDLRQVLVPAPHADFGGAACASFDAVHPGLYVSNRPASAFRFCHDGTGVSWYCTLTALEATWTASRFVWGTINGGGTNFALLLGGNAASGFRYEISNGAVIYNPTAAAGTTPNYVSGHYALTETPDVLYQLRTATVNNSNVTGVPSAGDPSSTLLLGANPGFGNLGRFRWRNLMFFPLLTAPQRAVVEAYIAADTGLT
jgi:hypothetical protein